jgi:hypothetical protein
MEIVREGKEGGKGRMARFSGGIGSVGLRGNRERTNAMRRARRSPTGYCPRCNGAVHLSEIKPLGGVLGCSLCRREIRATSLKAQKEEKEKDGPGLADGGRVLGRRTDEV